MSVGKSKVKTGIDLLSEQNFKSLKGKTLAVLAHPASVSSELRHTVDIIAASSNCKLQRIFAPEHGFRGDAQYMVAVKDEVDFTTGVEVASLYGSTRESLSPGEKQLSDIDVLLVDLQDVGSRYYTYTQTMLYCMQVAAKTGTKVLVLDRPNPIGGEMVEGAVLINSCRSFCGELPVANRHGLTIGEFAMLSNAGFSYGDNKHPALNCDLEVIRLENWQRNSYFDNTGLPWVLPSPNMPTLETALVYPGACLFEACNISEGRGTTRPFELLGAPFIDGRKWADATLNQGIVLTGATLRPTYFSPKFDKSSGQVCGAVQIHITDRAVFKPFRWGLALISAAAELYPKDFSWRKTSYEFIDSVPAIDLLYGSDEFRLAVEKRKGLAEIEKKLNSFEADYFSVRKSALVY